MCTGTIFTPEKPYSYHCKLGSINKKMCYIGAFDLTGSADIHRYNTRQTLFKQVAKINLTHKTSIVWFLSFF